MPRPLGWTYGRACGSAASHRMSAARIVRSGGHCEAFDGSLTALLASLFGPTHINARCGAACTSLSSASSRSPKLARASCSKRCRRLLDFAIPDRGLCARTGADLHVGAWRRNGRGLRLGASCNARPPAKIAAIVMAKISPPPSRLARPSANPRRADLTAIERGQ